MFLCDWNFDSVLSRILKTKDLFVAKLYVKYIEANSFQPAGTVLN